MTEHKSILYTVVRHFYLNQCVHSNCTFYQDSIQHSLLVHTFLKITVRHRLQGTRTHAHTHARTHTHTHARTHTHTHKHIHVLFFVLWGLSIGVIFFYTVQTVFSISLHQPYAENDPLQKTLCILDKKTLFTQFLSLLNYEYTESVLISTSHCNTCHTHVIIQIIIQILTNHINARTHTHTHK